MRGSMAGRSGSKAATRGPVPDDLEDIVRETLRTSPGVKGTELKKKLPASHQPFSKEALELAKGLAVRGEAFLLVKGKTAAFFPKDPSLSLDEALLGKLARQALKASELKTAAAELGAAYAALLPAWLKVALERRVVFKHAPDAYSALPDVNGKLVAVFKALQTALAKTDADGIPRLAVANALLAKLELPLLASTTEPAGYADGNARTLFLKALETLAAETPHAALLSIRDLRARLALGKDDFDRTALELMREHQVSLTHHDHANSLSEAERDAFVRDGQGNYYNGVAPRRGS